MCAAVRRTNYVVARKKIDLSRRALSLYDEWEKTRNEEQPLGTRASFLVFTRFMSEHKKLYGYRLFQHQQKEDIRMAFQYFTKIQKAEPPLTKAA